VVPEKRAVKRLCGGGGSRFSSGMRERVVLMMFHVKCQERETALDAVMERLRQEGTEAGLKDGLKKAMQMLDAIRARFAYC